MKIPCPKYTTETVTNYYLICPVCNTKYQVEGLSSVFPPSWDCPKCKSKIVRVNTGQVDSIEGYPIYEYYIENYPEWWEIDDACSKGIIQ